MPIFIAVEGIEGVGKSSVISIIADVLSAQGYVSRSTREPGGTDLAEQIRSLLKSKEYTIDEKTELLLMFAARSHHVQSVIMPSLKDGVSIISDRYVAASYAYQGAARAGDEQMIKTLDQYACEAQPDLTVLITCPVEVALTRIKLRNIPIDRIESESAAFFERAQEKYLELAHNNPAYIVVDGTGSLEDVQYLVRQEVSSWLSAR